ncbi:MAG: hypothetical protein KKE36_09660, partial [Actinobacteria bacterium]|nr:hypothetical protein [Actinomycetota bacterium]
MRGAPGRKSVVYLLVLILFVVLAIVYTRPLVAQADDHLIGAAGGDNYFNIYVLSWDVHALGTSPLNLFNATMFYPGARTLAFSDHELTSALIAWPVLAATGNGVLALNFAVFMTFVLSAMGAFLLVEHLARDRAAGVAAGIVFGFAMYRTAQITHLQLLSAGFIPLAMLFLHRYTERKRPGDAFAFALFVVLQFWAVWSYGFYLLFALAVYLVVLAVFERRRLAPFLRRKASAERRPAIRWSAWLLAAMLAAGLLVLPFAVPYLKAQRENPSFSRSPDEVAAYSADLGDFLVAPPQSMVWGGLSSWARPARYLRGNATERSLFTGVLPLLQHALLELFQRRNGNLLTLAAYNEIGGVQGALAHRANGVVN